MQSRSDGTLNAQRLQTIVLWTAGPFVALIVALFGLALLAGADYTYEAALIYAHVSAMAAAGVMVLGSLAWGAGRILHAHPRFNEGYREWLARTPWQAGMPLPRGPIRLRGRDAVMAVAFTLGCVPCLLLPAPTPEIATPPMLFLLAPAMLMVVGAAAALALSNRLTGQRESFYGALAACAALLWVAPTMVGVVAIPIATYVIGLAGARRSLDVFPWSKPAEPAADGLGWPYALMLRQPAEVRTPRQAALLNAALAFALVAGSGQHIAVGPNEVDELVAPLWLWCLMTTSLLAIVRLAHYSPAICPRLCWGERVGRGRWIVPEHDVVFAVPALIFASGVIPLLVLPGLGVWLSITAGVSVALPIFLTFGFGPRVEELFYTGRHAVGHAMPMKHERNYVSLHS